MLKKLIDDLQNIHNQDGDVPLRIGFLDELGVATSYPLIGAANLDKASNTLYLLTAQTEEAAKSLKRNLESDCEKEAS